MVLFSFILGEEMSKIDIIKCYLRLVDSMKKKEQCSCSRCQNFFSLGTDFLTRFISRGFEPSKHYYFSYDSLIIPVPPEFSANTYGYHWTLIVIGLKMKTCIWYDPAKKPNEDFGKMVFDSVESWFRQELKARGVDYFHGFKE